jgi:hypothetical protein
MGKGCVARERREEGEKERGREGGDALFGVLEELRGRVRGGLLRLAPCSSPSPSPGPGPEASRLVKNCLRRNNLRGGHVLTLGRQKPKRGRLVVVPVLLFCPTVFLVVFAVDNCHGHGSVPVG